MIEHGPRVTKVRGIPVMGAKPYVVKTLRRVLATIQDRQPDDYDRLKRVITLIRPMTAKEREDDPRCSGEWKPEDAETSDPATWGRIEVPGVLIFNGELSGTELVGVLAHELGHACTIDEDLSDRGRCPSGEWASETTANWYADRRWGFGHEIRTMMTTAERLHHGAMPGETIWGDGWEFLVDEDYRWIASAPE